MNSGPNQKPNILIVDDKRENLLALDGLLKDEDSNILRATSGNEALAQLLDNDCAVILLDVQMPDMDGFETASLIRQNRKTRNIPIIFVTAINKEEKYVYRGYELGAVDYLFKPLQPLVVKAKVKAFLELYKQRRELENLSVSLYHVNSKLKVSLREIRILNEDLEQFASLAAHDLKEPLRTIRSFLQLLQRKNEGKLDNDSNDYIQFAVNGAARMDHLISDLLEYARAGTKSFDLQTVDCNLILESAIQNLALTISEAQGEMIRESLPTLLGDKTQLLQLFQNLISNAIKFRGGRKPVIRVRVSNCEKEWEFAIEDNGLGIPMDEQANIFILFHRLHSRSAIDGSGIGLAVCRRIVERHGGRIWVESEPGKGSTFFFSIPKTGSPPAF